MVCNNMQLWELALCDVTKSAARAAMFCPLPNAWKQHLIIHSSRNRNKGLNILILPDLFEFLGPLVNFIEPNVANLLQCILKCKMKMKSKMKSKRLL